MGSIPGPGQDLFRTEPIDTGVLVPIHASCVLGSKIRRMGRKNVAPQKFWGIANRDSPGHVRGGERSRCQGTLSRHVAPANGGVLCPFVSLTRRLSLLALSFV